MPNRRFPKSRQAIVMLGLHLLALVGLATAARADVVINSATSGPVTGDDGAFTVTTSGTITSGGNGIAASTSPYSITALDVQGTVDAAVYALDVADGASLATTTNSGVMTGDRVIQTYGGTTIGSITNSGTMSASGYGVLLYGTSGTFANQAGGLVSATSVDAIYLIGPTGLVSNAGSVSAGANGLFVYNTLTTATNSGSIQGGSHGVYVNSTGSTGLLTNSGTITGSTGQGLQNSGVITTATNAGLITGVRGIQADPGSSFGVLANSGTVTGSEYGMVIYATTGTLSNAAGGLIQATTNTDGIFHEGTTTSFVNDGNIVGVRHGISNNGAGTLSAITNSGTISGPGGAGLQLNAATTTTTLSNSGVINGAFGIYHNGGSITTLTNSGTLHGSSAGCDGITLWNGGIGSLVNEVGGRIEGSGRGIYHASFEGIGSIDNAGTITGQSGFYAGGALGTFVNRSTGLILATGTGYTAFATNQLLDSFTNEAGGVIRSANGNSVSLGSVTTAVNAGTIEAASYGIQSYFGTIASFSNTGLISGTVRGFNQDAGGSLTLLTNSGTITSGSLGMRLTGNSGTISNLAGGRIAGTSDDGVLVSGNVTSLSNAGTIAGGSGSGDAGVQLVSSGTVGTLTNTGNITGFRGVEMLNSSGLGSLVNSGTIFGTSAAIYNYSTGTVTSIVNQAGGLIAGEGNSGINGGRYGTIDNYGTIRGPNGVSFDSNGPVGTLINRSGGVISGTLGPAFYNSREVGTVTNEVGGLMTSNSSDGMYINDPLTTFTNAGVLVTTRSGYDALVVNNTLTTLTNSGTIIGTRYGVNYKDQIITMDNLATGLIQGGNTGFYIGSSDPMTATNAGRIIGGVNGVRAYYTITGFTNQAGGVISGTSNAGFLIEDNSGTVTNEAGALIESAAGSGVRVGGYGTRYKVDEVANAGLITGANSGVRVENGLLKKLTNTGTIQYTGAGTGPAVRVGPGGVLGVASGTGGPAIVSTGAGALLAGTIVNSGTVFYGFQIENQSVTVSADGGLGRFTSGTLNVVNGNLTVTSGTTTLDAAISVNGGTGTVFNDATLRLLGIEDVTGNYQQNAGGVTLMDLLGTSSGQYGRLDISGSASFAGNLALNTTGLAGGLATGQTFQLFDFASSTGGFGSLLVDGTSLSSLGGGVWQYGEFKLTELWTGTTMSLSISTVPEIDPASMASVLSLVVGSLGLAERRLRRRNGRTG